MAGMASTSPRASQSKYLSNSSLSAPKKPSMRALSGQHPFLDIDRVTRPSSHGLFHEAER